VVGIKSSGETTYFYHDVALAEKLKASRGTLYLTGQEQAQHFGNLQTLFPQTHSIPLGLVSLNGGKMSSSLGNVIYLQPIWQELEATFGTDNPSLIWNVLSGYILKTTPSVAKKINLDVLANPKNSPGLYLSYTLAKLKSAGLTVPTNSAFHDPMLAWKKLVAQTQLNPVTLLTGLLEKAQEIATLYEQHRIKDHPENQQLFQPLAEDLLHGMQCLGLLGVDRV
jgi:arginyl-tRNA synthetase